MKTARQLNREIAEFLANDGSSSSSRASAKFKVVRRSDRETKSSEDHPGMSPPHQSALSIGREHEGWKPLYWKRVLAEYKKEAPRRGGLANTIELDLWVMHAPDAHTPFTRVEWPDPFDIRGAERFARQLIEDGGAQYAEVDARARRPYSKEEAVYTLANFARGEEPREPRAARQHATIFEPRRSAATKRLIEKARVLMSAPIKPPWSTIKKLDKQLHDQIHKAGGLSDIDPFWVRWGYFVEQHTNAPKKS